MLAALATAPSGGGFGIAVVVVALFLLRQPARVLASDLTAKRRLPRTRAAAIFFAAYFIVGSIGTGAVLVSASYTSLLPLVLLLPFGIYLLYKDVKGKSRMLLPELAASVVISASAPAILLSSGSGPREAFAVWGLFVLRSVPSVIYVRERLRLEKGKEYRYYLPQILQAFALGAVVCLVFLGFVPFLTVPVFLLLSARSVFGLSRFRTPMRAMRIGILETVYGALLVLAYVIGFYSGT